jgi:hypothetical protein
LPSTVPCCFQVASLKVELAASAANNSATTLQPGEMAASVTLQVSWTDFMAQRALPMASCLQAPQQSVQPMPLHPALLALDAKAQVEIARRDAVIRAYYAGAARCSAHRLLHLSFGMSLQGRILTSTKSSS